MKEDFLQYLWKHQLFSKDGLVTTTTKQVYVKSVGLHNMHEGPDFLNATIIIDGLVWFGHVEIHLKSSDWYAHHHQVDTNYHSVVLHVVWEDDVEVFDVGNQSLPTLEISHFISKELLGNYQRLFSQEVRWIPCERLIGSVDPFVINGWKTRLYVDRLEAKSELIDVLLSSTNSDYEAVLFLLLMKNFGLKINGDAFFRLAKSIQFSVVRKEQHDVLRLNALLFGQAGFLDSQIEDVYYKSLQSEYNYLKHKHSLKGLHQKQFQFFKIRPSNFPTIRIAQLAALYHQHQNLFSKLVHCTQPKEFYDLFDVGLHHFWKTHYTFQKRSPKKVKKVTRPFIELVLMNTIIPLKFNYFKSVHVSWDEGFLSLLTDMKSEKNAIISKFEELNVKSCNAFDSQALLELKNNYCAKKRCLHCAIGMRVLKSV